MERFDFVITSEHRCGSRWMHYLFRDILGKDTSPEIDSRKLYDLDSRREIIDRFKQNKIVKFHHATPIQLYDGLDVAAKENNYDINMKILGIVRNPRDQGVSLCFHNRYHNKHEFPEKKFDTDEEALNYTIFESRQYKNEITNMFSYMIPGYRWSTFSEDNYYPYMWTNYESLVANTFFNIKTILTFLHFDLDDTSIKFYVTKNAFESKSGRKPGDEDRKDNWRRKGIVGDWENHFTFDMIEETARYYNTYNLLCSMDI